MRRIVCFFILIIITVFSVEGGITIQIEKLADDFTIGKGQYLAPFGLKVCGTSGEKISGFSLVFSNLEREDIEEIDVFKASGEYNKFLINFPQDWQKIDGEINTNEFPEIQVNFKEDLELPVFFENRIEFLIGFKLKETIKGPLTFSVTLTSISFDKSNKFFPFSLKADILVDDKPPEIKVNTEKLYFSDNLTGIRINVETDEPLAFPAQIKPRFGWDAKKKGIQWQIRDYNKWRPEAEQVSSRISMNKVKDNFYQYDYLFLIPLSENDKDIKEKTISYSLDPYPDQWGARKDDTGYDLIDGDARPGWFCISEVRWDIGSDPTIITFDLKDNVLIGRVIVYCWENIDRIEIWGKKEEDENWQKMTSLPGISFPLYQYYIEPHLNLYVAEANFSQLQQIRYLKILLFGEGWKTVTEIEIWGFPQSGTVIIPNGFNIYAIDKVGNTSKYNLKIEK
ncbi:MAG TPA: hypothetical protein PLW95_07760 [bacterium]|nr:hypothetical protein [bacterium]